MTSSRENDMEEKLFVIAEVKQVDPVAASDGTLLYNFIGRPESEYIWLHPDSPALVRQSQLRYGEPCVGERGFSPSVGGGLGLGHWPAGFPETRLIIDSYAPSPATAWDKWLSESPVCDERVKAWIGRMPRGE
uniref:Uncharacterized protein n=1 Tax=viral metagenome TaxID=1070528 RepID=A0A6M3LKI8_9ZZZZ